MEEHLSYVSGGKIDSNGSIWSLVPDLCPLEQNVWQKYKHLYWHSQGLQYTSKNDFNDF